MIEPEIEPGRNLASVESDDVAQFGQIFAALIVIDPGDVARGGPAQQPALDDAILAAAPAPGSWPPAPAPGESP